MSTACAPPEIVPCIWLDDQAAEAARFYTDTFDGGQILGTSYYPDAFEKPGGKPSDAVLTVAFEIAGKRFTALNGGPEFSPNPTISFFVHVDTPAEADALFASLAEGGAVFMPIGEYHWSERYGWVQDRYGVSWQIMCGRRPESGATIAPCLMFAGEQRARARAAIDAYTQIFPESSIAFVEAYEEGEAPKGAIKHGRFILAGQDFVAMDSHIDHGVSFDEGISLQVMCQTQAEIDRYWSALSEGGEPGRCGWLADRFGVSWQVVPALFPELLASDDVDARDRTFEAMLPMEKLDVAALQAAFDGD